MNPRTALDTSATAGQRPEAEAPAIAHVLVVDDKQIVRDFLREVLGMAGHEVHAVEGGPEALARCEEHPPQVLLTDMNMEPMDGQELIRQVKARWPSVVPVVLTGYGTVERTVELMRIGAFDVLTKPCRAQEITATIERALEHHHALHQNVDLRKRLQVHDRLAMIGKLAAGVAHELNNPLDAVLRCVRLTQDRVQDDDEAIEYLDLAHAGLLRMADIVQSLLTFSRNAAVEQAPQPLEALVEEAIATLRVARGDSAPEIAHDLQFDVAHAPLPRGLHQVLMNLLCNAADAVTPAHKIEVRARQADGRLLIEVVDNGPGIDEAVLPRIFEPFFTTKDPGKGTGLGLPISARLVEKFGGSMRVECPEEGGTVVTVSLPADRYLDESMSALREEN